MSETNYRWTIPSETVNKLATISGQFKMLNTGATGDDFWLIDQGDNEGDYSWSQIAIGINASGELLWATDSGCSCNGPWENDMAANRTWPLTDEITIDYESWTGFDDPIPELVRTTDTLYEVLTGDAVEAEAILALPNAEIRRAVVELVGYDKIIDRAEVLDVSDTDGRLLKIKQDNDEDIVLVHVKDPSTEREYFLRVPPDMQTARQARAWTFGFEAEDFAPEIER